MTNSTELKRFFAAGRPLVEGALDIAEQIAALRDAASKKGLDWSQIKALLKAQIEDERDGRGDGKRVNRLIEKADFACAYAGMLGLGNMNEKNISPPVPVEPPPHDPETGEVMDAPEPMPSPLPELPAAAYPPGAEPLDADPAVVAGPPDLAMPDMPPFLARQRNVALEAVQ